MTRYLRRLRRPIDERGAVAVEAALITPILILLVFGAIEFTLLLRDNVAITSMVRAGARIASAEPRLGTVSACATATPVDACFAQDAVDAIQRQGSALPKDNINYVYVYKANQAGMPMSGDFSSCPTDSCYKYLWNKSTNRFVYSTGQWKPTSINACPGFEGDAVGVYLNARHNSVTGLFFGASGFTLTDHAVMKFEPIDTTLGQATCKP